MSDVLIVIVYVLVIAFFVTFWTIRSRNRAFAWYMNLRWVQWISRMLFRIRKEEIDNPLYDQSFLQKRNYRDGLVFDNDGNPVWETNSMGEPIRVSDPFSNGRFHPEKVKRKVPTGIMGLKDRYQRYLTIILLIILAFVILDDWVLALWHSRDELMSQYAP